MNVNKHGCGYISLLSHTVVVRSLHPLIVGVNVMVSLDFQLLSWILFFPTKCQMYAYILKYIHTLP